MPLFPIRGSSVVIAALAVGSLGLGGCATKKFVAESVNNAVTPVTAQVAQHDTQIAALDRTSREALERATAAGKLAEGKFLYSVVLSDDAVKFASNKAELSPEAQARLNELAERLKAENKNVYVEIQGHTDDRADPNYNIHLGEERAEAARRFLAHAGIALNRMSTISYGEEEPVAPNTTRDGRAQNRRVVMVVLS